jgi:hypothetical protein
MMLHRRSVLSLVLLTAAAIPACTARSAPGASGPTAPPRRFDLRSSFWVNLHHRLFAETNPPFAKLGDQDRMADFSPGDREAWGAALALYRSRFPARTILATLDPPLSTLNATLADQPEGSDLSKAGLDPELTGILLRAARAYRVHGWAADDRENRAWIGELERRLEAHADAFVRGLSAAYERPWPAEPIPTEVAVRAGMVGAYTVGDRITIASGLATYRGDAALEMIFHEASHVVGEPVLDAAIDRAARARGRPVPENLWHAILFYTAGDVARRLLPGYTPYAQANGLYSRSPDWTAYEGAIRARWQPHLDGKIGLDAAIAEVIAALPVAVSP